MPSIAPCAVVTEMALLNLVLALPLVFLPGIVSAANPVVEVNLGKINGVLCGANDSAVAQFLAIPYARPPIGRFRWTAPSKYTTKYPASGLDATKPGPICRQGTDGNEDCLYLNVWAPANLSTLNGKKLPVRVFIHGGGYQTGSGMDDTYNGCRLANDGNVVMVTMNYRLGIFGFMALSDLRDRSYQNTVGNWGLLDQRLALQWVRDNIGAFGGDRSKVMLSGESAGAYSTLLHITSPWSKGLFYSAVSFSGSADAMAVDFLPDAYRKGAAIRDALNCSMSVAKRRGFSNTRDCLRSAPAEAVMAVQAELCAETVQYCVPTIDGRFLPKHPVTIMQQGGSANVSVLLGVNANEGALEVIAQTRQATNIDMPTFFGVVNNLISVAPSFNARLYEQYDADKRFGGNWIVSAIHAITDGGYHCPSRRAARAFAKQGLPTRYHILEASQPNSGCILFLSLGAYLGQEITDFMGAFHSYDVPLSFMAPFRSPYNNCPFTANETQLSAFLSGITSAMAATGSPLPPRTKSLTSPLLKPANLTWPVWTPGSELIMDIDTAGLNLYKAADLLMDAKCQLWDDILAADITAGTTEHA